MDETTKAVNYLRSNAWDYRSRFGHDRNTFRYISAIKQVREDLGLTLRVAKDAMDQWRDAGFPSEFSNAMPNITLSGAKLIVQNLLLRGLPGLTSLEMDAIRILAD